MHNFKKYWLLNCILKTLKSRNLRKKDIKNESANMKNRKQKSVYEKMPPTYGAFY